MILALRANLFNGMETRPFCLSNNQNSLCLIFKEFSESFTTHPSAMAWKPISISNLFFISLSSFHFVAPSTQLYGRSGCDIDPDIDIEPTLDGPTSDQSPGIGVEFETSKIVFQNNECSYEDTNGAKGKEILGRTGDDWKLTADTTVDTAGILQAEYILDGTIIKIDTGRAKSAAAKLQNDLVWYQQTIMI